MESDFYLDFENNFRGSRNQVSQILSNYDGLMNYILSIDKEPSLLDIGCGRGEWMQKCSNHGFKSCGIELNSKMVEMCKDIGLDIIQGDAIKVLKELPDKSFSLISCFHMIEHINFDSINKILIECKRLLKDEGLLILETPSIDNLSISSRLFHIDPTHINPINAELLSFTLNRIGYDMVIPFFINGGPLQNEDKYSLTRIFNGVAQDLMILATNSRFSSEKLIKNKLWKNTIKTGLTTIQACIEFDNQLRMKMLESEEKTLSYRARIYNLERKLDILLSSPFYTIIKLTSKGNKNCIYIINKLKIFFKLITIKVIRRILRFTYKLTNIVFLNKSYLVHFIFQIFNKILDRLGFVVKSGKLLRKSLKIKEDINYINDHQSKLDLNYELSLRSKEILKDLQ